MLLNFSRRPESSAAAGLEGPNGEWDTLTLVLIKFLFTPFSSAGNSDYANSTLKCSTCAAHAAASSGKRSVRSFICLGENKRFI